MSARVCILTTVHPVFDTRIFHKQAQALAGAGYEVVLIAPHERDEEIEGIRLVALSKPRNRFIRIFGLAWQAFRLALRQRADVYHFHDPELIPVMLLLKAFRRVPVVYDVHEDYVTSIMQKGYLPKVLQRPLALAVALLEKMAARAFTVVLAERYYVERFPKGTTVLNYPKLVEHSTNGVTPADCVGAPRILYTGNVTEDRGALIHAKLPRLVDGLHVYMVGRCGTALAGRIRVAASPSDDRLHLEGVGRFVPYETIRSYYAAGDWLAGVALFPPTEHYKRKELTKLFEYMAAGMPVLCSHFPLWREIVEGNQCGLCVDPLDPQAIATAIEWLLAHPDEARRMGDNGRQAVEEKYNWETEARKLVALYDKLLARRRARRGGT